MCAVIMSTSAEKRNEMTTEMISPSLPNIEVDKIPGAWVLTWWLPDNGATLRLKVEHTSGMEPDTCVAQVKLRPDEEFQSIGEFLVAVFELLHPEECDRTWCDDLPDIWTEEFKALVQVWGRLQSNIEFGSTMDSRYSGEPASSVDHFYCEAHYVPIMKAEKTDPL
jgi:hypothetical protein